MSGDGGPPIDARSLGEKCDDHSVRVEKIVHVPTMLLVEDVDSEVIEWVTDGALSIIAELLGATVAEMTAEVWPNHRGRLDWEGFLSEVLRDKGINGWFIEAAHPGWKKIGDRGLSVSWGSYYTKVFYAATYEDAVDQACRWAEHDHDTAMAGGQ